MREEVNKSAAILRKGGIILYPTDTVWGLGCDATNEEAVQKIFRIKKRSEAKSMIVLVGEAHQVDFYAAVPAVAKDLVEFAEKPLTIIYPKAKGLAKSLVAEDGSVGIRVVKDEFCQHLIHFLHRPLVSTSANISGEPAPANFSEISDEIKDNVDYVVNLRQHETQKSTPSQIIKLGMDGTIEIIRK
jgi:L-threonylcarbamoyladenylate synthase